MSTVASAHTVTDSPRRAGRWLVASGVVFVAGYVLAILAPEGSLLGDLVVAPLALGALMLIVATALAVRVVPARLRPLAIGAVVLAAACAVAMIGLMATSVLIELQQAPLDGWTLPLVIVTCACGGAAVAAVAVALRAGGFARRTALVVAVLGVVVLLACFVMEPVVPFVLAAVLGVPLARSTASATM